MTIKKGKLKMNLQWPHVDWLIGHLGPLPLLWMLGNVGSILPPWFPFWLTHNWAELSGAYLRNVQSRGV